MENNELEKLLDEYKDISEFVGFLDLQIKNNTTDEGEI